jgi:hypothetical protein
MVSWIFDSCGPRKDMQESRDSLRSTTTPVLYPRIIMLEMSCPLYPAAIMSDLEGSPLENTPLVSNRSKSPLISVNELEGSIRATLDINPHMDASILYSEIHHVMGRLPLEVQRRDCFRCWGLGGKPLTTLWRKLRQIYWKDVAQRTSCLGISGYFSPLQKIQISRPLVSCILHGLFCYPLV